VTQPAESSSSCNTCQWWDPPAAEDGPGQCRRFPPTGGPVVAVSAWPLVFGSDWCGEWKNNSAPAQVPTN